MGLLLQGLLLILILSITSSQESLDNEPDNDVIDNIHEENGFSPDFNITQKSNYKFVNDLFDYYICADNGKYPNCHCHETEIKCDLSIFSGYHYYEDDDNYTTEYPVDTSSDDMIMFKNLNIKIMNETIVVKTAIFNDYNIVTLEKKKMLPGHEHTIETLNLKSNKIVAIENGTFDNFISLKHLDLSTNQLTNITDGVLTKLGSHLITLKLGHNKFKSIFVLNISHLIKLEELDLSGNHIDTSIRDFNASVSYFKSFIFPKSLSNLKTLRLNYCGISAFNDMAFVNLRNLENLEVKGFHLNAVPKAFNALTNLEFLDIGGSQIFELNEISFEKNINLKQFYMTHSSLKRIDSCTFCNKPNLKRVILYHNKGLSYIHEYAFGNVLSDNPPPSLEAFYVGSCKLSMIPENLLNWNTVKEFGLGNNPFICNCSMAWLVNDILSPTYSMNMKEYINFNDYHPYAHENNHEKHSLKCHGPLALKDVPFIKLSEKFCKNDTRRRIHEFSWSSLFHNAVVIIVAFVFGMSVIPCYQYLFRLKKQRTAFRCSQENNVNFNKDLNLTKF